MNKILPTMLLLVMFCASCTTYELSLGTLQDKFEKIDSTDLAITIVRGPLGKSYSYLTHPDKTILLQDKDGQQVLKVITPSLEMRVTYDNGRRSYFYLDKVFLTNEYLIGDRSRFSNAFRKKILINSIEKIEVQDGKKNFRYE